jgi:hypothetical protein
MRTVPNLSVWKFAVGFAAAALVLGACSNSKTDAGPAADTGQGNAPAITTVNSVCPYSLKAVNASAPTRQYEGKTVGFCCAGCAGGWDSATDDTRATLMAKTTAK